MNRTDERFEFVYPKYQDIEEYARHIFQYIDNLQKEGTILDTLEYMVTCFEEEISGEATDSGDPMYVYMAHDREIGRIVLVDRRTTDVAFIVYDPTTITLESPRGNKFDYILARAR